MLCVLLITSSVSLFTFFYLCLCVMSFFSFFWNSFLSKIQLKNEGSKSLVNVDQKRKSANNLIKSLKAELVNIFIQFMNIYADRFVIHQKQLYPRISHMLNCDWAGIACILCRRCVEFWHFFPGTFDTWWVNSKMFQSSAGFQKVLSFATLFNLKMSSCFPQFLALHVYFSVLGVFFLG